MFNDAFFGKAKPYKHKKISSHNLFTWNAEQYIEIRSRPLKHGHQVTLEGKRRLKSTLQLKPHVGVMGPSAINLPTLINR
jgi:hypothetical protein